MTETEIKLKGMAALHTSLGLVEAERFVSLMQREPFDYTKWRKNLFPDISLNDLNALIVEEYEGLKTQK